jgi:hypothetical protein
MWNLEKILGSIGTIGCGAIGYYKFGYAGIFLVFATVVAASIYFSGVCAEPDMDEQPERNSCSGCKNDLGGGCCSLNLEDECAAGGGYELWEEDNNVETD